MGRKKIRVKDMPAGERPREKLLELGAGALSNAELIAVLLGSGTSAAPVMNVAAALVKACGNDMFRLSGMGTERLCQFKGIGPARAIALQAAMELGTRANGVRELSSDNLFITSDLQIIEGWHPPGTPVQEASLRTFVPLPEGSKKRRLFDIGERNIILLATGNFAKVRSYQQAESALADESPDRRI